VFVLPISTMRAAAPGCSKLNVEDERRGVITPVDHTERRPTERLAGVSLGERDRYPPHRMQRDSRDHAPQRGKQECRAQSKDDLLEQ
jgi:hypothetical protein